MESGVTLCKDFELNPMNDFFETMYFGKGWPGTAMTASERVNVLFQTAREYRELLCHENELQNKRKTLFWSTQAGLCTAYYYIFLRREEITQEIVGFGEIALQVFLCVWGMISTVRFLRGLYFGARANRFLLFRWQAFVELYISCVWSKERKRVDEKTWAFVDIPISVTPFFPPVIGLADPREGLRVNEKDRSEVNEEIILNCNEKSCAKVLEQIISDGRKTNSKSSWYFDCKPGRLAKWYKAEMHKYYDVLLIGWWAALYLYTITIAARHIAESAIGMIILIVFDVIGLLCFGVKALYFCKENSLNFKAKMGKPELRKRFYAWIKNKPYRREGGKTRDKENNIVIARHWKDDIMSHWKTIKEKI